MTQPVYYNEFDPFAAAWLRALIAAGHLPAGEVDERDIWDVRPDDLRSFRQCHFFAGIGGWAYAARLARWPADWPLWTGSCPCQPFSAAGKGLGFADERHLWPAWFHLIDECRPPIIAGEQVAKALGWLDLVYADLEGADYTVWAGDLCAPGVGAFHIRQRLWFVADAGRERRQQDARGTPHDEAADGRARWNGSEPDSDHFVAGDGQDHMAHPARERRDGQHALLWSDAGRRLTSVLPEAHRGGEAHLVADAQRHPREPRRLAGESREGAGAPHTGAPVEFGRCGDAGELGDPNPTRSQGRRLLRAVGGGISADQQLAGPSRLDGPTFWADADWLPCIDDKSRPVEPGTFPLAHGIPARVGRLRGYGNAIVPQVAAEVLRAYLDTYR